LQAPLSLYNFSDNKKAWTNLQCISKQVNFSRLFVDFFSNFLNLVGESYNADIALSNFERFSEKINDKDYLYSLLTESHELMKALVTLFSGSQVLTDTLLQDPSHFDWLKIPETLNASKPKDILMRDYYEMAGDEHLTSAVPSLLRRFKKREYIRIGLRDLLGNVTLTETVKDLSNLADVCLQAAYEYSNETCRKKYGAPMYEDADKNSIESEFAILGMGKLGGQELNYSSDIDLIYIYTSSVGETQKLEGCVGSWTQVSNHEFFTRLGVMLTKTIHEITSDGNVFRVDLNLRPEGQSGEIVNSLASSEIYYESWGKTWERQALIKARVSAGSEALGKKFFELMEPFIFRRNLDFSAIQEVKSMKSKINQSLKGKKIGRGHIKLGFGGIRELEFIVQGFQLLFGGKDKSLRITNTIQVLEKLCQLGFLTQKDSVRLKQAYTFLRNLENRVQISFGLQTHLLPQDDHQLAVLARKMNMEGDTPEALTKNLLMEFDSHREFVGGMFAGLFEDDEKRQSAEATSKESEQKNNPLKELTLEQIEETEFADPKRVYQFLLTLRDGPQFSHPSGKSVKDFYAILPRILAQSAGTPKPNSAVENLVKFIEASGARDSYLSLLHENDKFLELLLILFGSSDFLSGILIKQPGLMDVLTDMNSIYRFKPQSKIAEEFTRSLSSTENFEQKQIRLRRAKQGEELRIGVRYLIKEADLMGTLGDLSNLADVYLQTVFEIACQELNKKSKVSSPLPDDFAIVALGKLGARELNFGSDLDIIYVYEESAEQNYSLPHEEILPHYVSLSQMIYKLTSEMTPAGAAYAIDTDLRPEGSSGVLVRSIEGYEKYFKDRAKVWEQQAMTRARFVAGKPEVGKRFMQVIQDFTYRGKLEYGSLIEISRLRERMEKELAKESTKGKNVKLGYGGLVDIEFILQILQLMHGHKHSRLTSTATLELVDLLADFGILSPEDTSSLKKNYLFLRNLECSLRILKQPFSNHLPKKENELGALAKLLGYKDATVSELNQKLKGDYSRATSEVRKFYIKTLDNLLRTSL